MHDNTNRRAGAKLRQLREARRWTQRDVERETAARFGPEARVVSQQVSRIEKGLIDKPPVVDLLHVGEILGLESGDVLELYGLWRPPAKEEIDPVLREAINLSRALPEDVRREHLGWIEFANARAAAEMRKRMQAE